MLPATRTGPAHSQTARSPACRWCMGRLPGGSRSASAATCAGSRTGPNALVSTCCPWRRALEHGVRWRLLPLARARGPHEGPPTEDSAALQLVRPSAHHRPEPRDKHHNLSPSLRAPPTRGAATTAQASPMVLQASCRARQPFGAPVFSPALTKAALNAVSKDGGALVAAALGGGTFCRALSLK